MNITARVLFWMVIGLLLAFGAPHHVEAQQSEDDIQLIRAAYQGLLGELPDGLHAVVEDSQPIPLAGSELLDPEDFVQDSRRLAAELGLEVGRMDDLMPCSQEEERRYSRPSCPLAGDLVALVSFRIHSRSADEAVVLAAVWRTGENGRMAMFGGYKGFGIRLIQEGVDEWKVESVGVYIDS